jgi:hypothetical protein
MQPCTHLDDLVPLGHYPSGQMIWYPAVFTGDTTAGPRFATLATRLPTSDETVPLEIPQHWHGRRFSTARLWKTQFSKTK